MEQRILCTGARINIHSLLGFCFCFIAFWFIIVLFWFTHTFWLLEFFESSLIFRFLDMSLSDIKRRTFFPSVRVTWVSNYYSLIGLPITMNSINIGKTLNIFLFIETMLILFNCVFPIDSIFRRHQQNDFSFILNEISVCVQLHVFLFILKKFYVLRYAIITTMLFISILKFE